jgi:hypothetical protein
MIDISSQPVPSKAQHGSPVASPQLWDSLPRTPGPIPGEQEISGLKKEVVDN